VPRAGRLDSAIRGQVDQVGRRVAELAASQHGVVARAQLLAFGLSSHVIDRWVAVGRLHTIHRGVYAVGHTVLTQKGRWMAAVLACGDGALLSHVSAVALWDLLPTSSANIHVTVPSRSGRARRRGLRLHRSTSLHPDDAARRDGIPVTSLARTLVDFAEVARRDRLDRAVEKADQRHMLDMSAMDAACERARCRPGATRLTTALAAYRPTDAVMHDGMERRFFEICRDAGLPQPAMNVWIAGHSVDACWPEYGLAVELDSRTWHEARAAFQRDRERDRALQLAGLRCIRFTSRDVDDAADVATTVTRLLVMGGHKP
jgi:Transcriptional regulator, AbiEi antitoxin